MNRILILMSFLLLLLTPKPALSDCVDLGRSTNWYVEGDHTIVFYRQNSPLAKVDLQDCTVTGSSNVRLMKSYTCDSDRLLVDGQECAIMTLTSASGGSFE